MRLILKELQLNNFKGIRDLKINFLEGVNTIQGENASGKTTVFDAYMWLLWGTDSLDRTDFGIKTYVKDGDTLHGVEHTVTGVIEVDGQEIKLSKTYKEVWTKKRGSTEAERTGNTTDYYINDVPLKMKDYTDRISSLISKDDFKLLSNPLHFSSNLSWKDRRDVLFQSFGSVTDDEIIQANPDLKDLNLDNYSIDEIAAMNKATRSKLNNERKELPVRIDELIKSKKDYDYEALEFQRRFLQPTLEGVVKEIQGIAKNSTELKATQDQMQKLYDEKNEIEDQVNTEYLKAYDEYNRVQMQIKEQQNEVELAKQRELTKENKLKMLDYEIQEHEKNLEYLRDEWISNNAEEFDQDTLLCPTCRQEYPKDKALELQETFNLNKSKELERIAQKANKIKLLINKANEQKIEINTEHQENIVLEEIEALPRPEKVYPQRYYDIDNEIKDISQCEKTASSDTKDLEDRKTRIESEIKELDAKLASREENESIDRRIEEYKAKEKETARLYEEAERMLYMVEEYLKTKAELVSKSINSHFKDIEFKLFDVQENGGISETCEPLIDGVPYSDANNAAKINAGLEVIKVLSEIKGLSVPIFIDNAESVNEILETVNQQVRLVVSKDKELKIN